MGNRLYVGNLPFTATTGTLREAFAASGDVTDVHIVTDRESGQSRGFGFVTMGNAHEAAKAIASMNGVMLAVMSTQKTRSRRERASIDRARST